MMKNNLHQSFSLIEVLVFVTILSLFFVMAATIATVSLRNMKINEHKIIATHYGKEILSWLRNEKDSDWNAFSNFAATVNPTSTTYCFNGVTPSWPAAGDCAVNDFSLGSLFKREVLLSKNAAIPPTQFNVKINVYWRESGSPYSTTLNTVFTVWE